jgi:hypothetical protein
MPREPSDIAEMSVSLLTAKGLPQPDINLFSISISLKCPHNAVTATAAITGKHPAIGDIAA